MRVSSALERRIDMWNEKHDVYGWNLNRHSEFYGSNPCKGCSNFIENFLIVNYPQLKVQLVILMEN